MLRSVILVLFSSVTMTAAAQVGIGTTSPAASSALDVESTTGGFIAPRMTTAERTAIASPATGLLVFQTDGTGGFYYYTGSAWVNLSTFPVNLASTADVTGILAASNGGTGVTGFTSGQLLFGQGNNTSAGVSANLYWNNTDGYLGVGTNNPKYPLDIESTVTNRLNGTIGYLSNSTINTTGTTNNTGNTTFSIYAVGKVAATEYYAYSDERIKDNVHTLEDTFSTRILDHLRPVSFEYIDKQQKGAGTKYGFLAQELEQWMPSAVERGPGYIPNVFSLVTDGSATVDCPAGTLKEGDEVKLITAEGERIVAVKSVQAAPPGDGQSAYSGGPQPGNPAYESVTLDWANPDQRYLVYGTKVNDLRTVDYEQLIALCVNAIQEIDRKLDEPGQDLLSQVHRMSKKERRQLRKMLR